jgi:hypothetical protein
VGNHYLCRTVPCTHQSGASCVWGGGGIGPRTWDNPAAAVCYQRAVGGQPVQAAHVAQVMHPARMTEWWGRGGGGKEVRNSSMRHATQLHHGSSCQANCGQLSGSLRPQTQPPMLAHLKYFSQLPAGTHTAVGSLGQVAPSHAASAQGKQSAMRPPWLHWAAFSACTARGPLHAPLCHGNHVPRQY